MCVARVGTTSGQPKRSRHSCGLRWQAISVVTRHASSLDGNDLRIKPGRPNKDKHGRAPIVYAVIAFSGKDLLSPWPTFHRGARQPGRGGHTQFG